jgi:hypothetical protein
MFLLAHAGHILIDAPLFLAPMLLLGGALFVSARRQRHRDRQESNH